MKKLVFAIILLIFTQPTLADTNSEIVAAAIDGQTETLRSLIAGSTDIRSDGESALMAAAFSALERQGIGDPYDDQVEAVKVLANAGVDVDENSDDGMTALMLMAILGQTEVVQVLIDAGADINSVASSDGSTALIFAVYGGKTEIVSALIKAGAIVETADAGTGNGDGRTALSYAEEKEHAEIVGVLREAGAK